MTAQDRTASLQRTDGTVEAWIDGWHITFPSDGGEPHWERDDPPDPPPTGTEVQVAHVGTRTGVRRGRWMVMISHDDCHAIQTKPKPKVDRRVYRLMAPPQRGRD